MLKKVFLTGRYLDVIRAHVLDAGFEVVENSGEADVIISHGGDGTMLGAEREFPGKLKFPIRDSVDTPLCAAHSVARQIAMLKQGTLKQTRLPKLIGMVNGRTISGINDIFLHNTNPVSAVRYAVWIDEELYGNGIVGDGLGVSTVHGSTAYYRSITHSIFRTGIGLAFSNSTELVNHLVLPESSVIRVTLQRGPCEIVADNSPERIALEENDEVIIRLSDENTPVLGLDVFMCPECRQLRHLARTKNC